MQVNYNPNIHRAYGQNISNNSNIEKNNGENKSDFAKNINSYIKKVNSDQLNSEASIQDLLTGKNQDINSVVASVAKADSSFNLLVGVRNKLIDAYKETMRMQL